VIHPVGRTEGEPGQANSKARKLITTFGAEGTTRPSEARALDPTPAPDPNPIQCNLDFTTWILGPDGREWCTLTDGQSTHQTDGHIEDENIASLIFFYLTIFFETKLKEV